MIPKNVKSLTNAELISNTDEWVQHERDLLDGLFAHFQEISDRKAYLELGYTTMYEYFIKRCKYSDTTAYERSCILKMAIEVPEIVEDLASGDLNITNITLAKTFFNKQEKETKQKVTVEEKREVLDQIKNKTTKEVKQLFAKINPVSDLPKDQIKYLSETHIQIQATTKKSLLEKLEYIKSLISHKNINPTYEEILESAFDALIEKEEKQKGIHVKASIKKSDTAHNRTNSNISTNSESIQVETDVKTTQEGTKAKSKNSTLENIEGEQKTAETLTQDLTVAGKRRVENSSPQKTTRYVKREVKKYTIKKAEHQCEHIHANGERCQSRFQLQFDHKQAFSKGGPNTKENIQILCRVHNALKSNA